MCAEWRPSRLHPGGLAEYVRVEAPSVARDALLLPPHVSFTGGAFVEPVSVAVHACQRAGDLSGRNVVVLGAGTIGNLIAQVAKVRGAAKVLITDLADYRLDVATRCGVDVAVNTATRSLKDAALDAFGPGGFDLAFEATGAEASLASAIHAIEKGGTILIVGVYGKPPVVEPGTVAFGSAEPASGRPVSIWSYWLSVRGGSFDP